MGTNYLPIDYLKWESSMVESQTSVEVNGNGALPLAEVNYAGWRLPITLYDSRVHKIDAR
jgi:hypothetical protein